MSSVVVEAATQSHQERKANDPLPPIVRTCFTMANISAQNTVFSFLSQPQAGLGPSTPQEEESLQRPPTCPFFSISPTSSYPQLKQTTAFPTSVPDLLILYDLLQAWT